MEKEEPIVSLVLLVPRVLVVTKNVIGLCVTMVITLVTMACEETVRSRYPEQQ